MITKKVPIKKILVMMIFMMMTTPTIAFCWKNDSELSLEETKKKINGFYMVKEKFVDPSPEKKNKPPRIIAGKVEVLSSVEIKVTTYDVWYGQTSWDNIPMSSGYSIEGNDAKSLLESENPEITLKLQTANKGGSDADFKGVRLPDWVTENQLQMENIEKLHTFIFIQKLTEESDFKKETPEPITTTADETLKKEGNELKERDGKDQAEEVLTSVDSVQEAAEESNPLDETKPADEEKAADEEKSTDEKKTVDEKKAADEAIKAKKDNHFIVYGLLIVGSILLTMCFYVTFCRQKIPPENEETYSSAESEEIYSSAESEETYSFAEESVDNIV